MTIEQSPNLEVRRVDTPADYHAYTNLPFKVKTDRRMVPPMLEFQRHLFDRGRRFRRGFSIPAMLDEMLLGKVNPFYQHGDLELFLALEGSTPVGRIAAIANRSHNEHYQDTTGFFGFYECLHDGPRGLAVTKGLVDAAGAWLRERGLTTIRGPFNPTINDDCGIWIDGDDYPAFMMPATPRYYADLLTAVGFEQIKRMRVYRRELAAITERTWQRFDRYTSRVLSRGQIRLRPANFKNLDDEVKTFLLLYNGALSENWGYAPMSFAELKSMAELFQYLLNPNLIRAVEVQENGVWRTVGATISAPDLNEILRHSGGRFIAPSAIAGLLRMKMGQMTHRVRIIFLGVLEEYRQTPAASLLLYDSVRQAYRLGAKQVEASWVLEDNPRMWRPLEEHDFQMTDEYGIFEKGLT